MLYIFARLHHARETEPQFQEEAFIIKTSRIKPALRTRGSAAGFRRARGRGRGRGEGTASALPQFPWVKTEKTGVIRGVFWGWIACGVLGGGGIPCGSGHPMDHAAPGTREKANPSSSHLAGRPRGAGGGGWVGGWTPLMHSCTPSFTGKQHPSFTRAKTQPVARPLVLAPARGDSQILNQLIHRWTEFFLK